MYLNLIENPSHMKVPAFIFLSWLLCACQEQGRKSNLSELIKGEWVEKQSYSRNTNQKRFWSFEDTVCLRNDFPECFFRYNIQHDTLFMESLPGQERNQEPIYTIITINPDSILLLPFTFSKIFSDTIKFSRIKAKNYIVPSAIYFASSGCFGTCPAMLLQIDSSQNLLFYGRAYTTITGGYSGKISRQEYRHIVSEINQLPLDSLQEVYEAPWTDDQTCAILIQYGGKLIRSSAYGHDKEPVELRILFNRLKALYKHIHLQPDSTVTEDYFLTHPDTANSIMHATASTLRSPPAIR